MAGRVARRVDLAPEKRRHLEAFAAHLGMSREIVETWRSRFLERVDEKNQYQALERSHPMLPMGLGHRAPSPCGTGRVRIPAQPDTPEVAGLHTRPVPVVCTRGVSDASPPGDRSTAYPCSGDR